MTEANECACGKPTRDAAYFCDHCGDTLSVALGEIPWLTDELEVSVTRQKGVDYRAATGGSGAKKPTERPSPVSWGPSEARAHLKAVLVSWALYCDAEHVRNQSPHPGLPADTLPALSRWLMWRVDGLSLVDIGPDAVDEITDAVARCRRIIDRPADRKFYGPCECGRDLYASAAAREVACSTCGSTYNAAEMSTWMVKQLEGKLMSLKEAAVVLDRMGFQIPDDTLKTWAKRGEKIRKHSEIRGVAVYLFDDLIKAAASWTPKKGAA